MKPGCLRTGSGGRVCRSAVHTARGRARASVSVPRAGADNPSSSLSAPDAPNAASSPATPDQHAQNGLSNGSATNGANSATANGSTAVAPAPPRAPARPSRPSSRPVETAPEPESTDEPSDSAILAALKEPVAPRNKSKPQQVKRPSSRSQPTGQVHMREFDSRPQFQQPPVASAALEEEKPNATPIAAAVEPPKPQAPTRPPLARTPQATRPESAAQASLSPPVAPSAPVASPSPSEASAPAQAAATPPAPAAPVATPEGPEAPRISPVSPTIGTPRPTPAAPPSTVSSEAPPAAPQPAAPAARVPARAPEAPPAAPKRPSAVSAAAAASAAAPTQPSAFSDSPDITEDLSVNEEIILEPLSDQETPQAAAAPAPAPPAPTISAPPSARSRAPFKAPLRGSMQLMTGPNGAAPPTQDTLTPPGTDSGPTANTLKPEETNKEKRTEIDKFNADESAVDLEHPDGPPEDTAGAAGAAPSAAPRPVMLSAPARAPPRRAAAPSTQSQDADPWSGHQGQGQGQGQGSGQRSSMPPRSQGGRGGQGWQPRGNDSPTDGRAQGQGGWNGKGRARVDTLGGRQREDGGGPRGGRGGGRGGARRGAGGRTGTLTAANRRKARKEKKELLAARREGNQRSKEEIFEVPSEGLSVGELADLLAVNAAEVVKALFMKGVMAQVNQQLDLDTVRLAAAAFGAEAVEADSASGASGKADAFVTEDDLEHLQPRPPVVCVMGHVDHGKTSLLDRIREASVAEGEAGGITQAIGAYNVKVHQGNEDGEGTGVDEVCFLDTPGHEAFSAMRARGARVTDIAIIIVAADDGVRPQTLEAVAHAKAAEVPIVVAINKIDKPGADVERVRGQMAGEADLVPEEWGGDTPYVSISAKKGNGIEDLLETVALVAEVEEFQANPLRAAQGTVLEAHLDRQVGPVATLLVQAGTLRKGDVVQAGASCGRVRKCSGSLGEEVEEALPSTAVSVIGLDAVPAAGDVFNVFLDEAEAREVAENLKETERKARLSEISTGSVVTLSTLATVDEEQDALQRMNLIVKADASGTLEAVKGALQGLPQDSVALRFLLASTGTIQPSDIELAKTSGALVIGFNTEVSEEAGAKAKSLDVEVHTFDVIYALLDEVRGRMEGRLKSVTEKVWCGAAEVKATFGKGKSVIGGCLVTEGKLLVDSVIEVRRGRKQMVFEGKLASLRRFKDEVSVVEEGVECGVGSDEFWEWEEGDKIQCFELVEKSLTLEESKADTVVDGDLEEALLAAQAEYEQSLKEPAASGPWNR